MTQTHAPRKPPDQPKRKKRDVNGWLVLDKPVGMTSTHAVSVVKRLLQAKRAGHAGTLDPLASGLLPIALGEATKTVPFVMDGRKSLPLHRALGRGTRHRRRRRPRHRDQRGTPDRRGHPRAHSALHRPIEQVPPRFSAVKIDGERAYDLARDGEVVELAPRPIEIHRLELVETPDPDHSVLAAECGKGTYVRALARDMGRALGCFGHVVALRRTAVGPFTEQIATNLEALQRMTQPGPEADVVTAPAILPVEAGLAALPALRVSTADAGRLARGQAVLLRGRDAPVMEGWVSVSAHGGLVALAQVEKGELRPRRIFNLARS